VAGNRFALVAKIVSRDELRHTPAGVPLLAFRVAHESEQVEAGVARRAAFEIDCILLGEGAQRMNAAAGASVTLRGFLAARSKLSRQLVFHVNEFQTS
jgi:primosomal replication protein N